uniref:G-protein coupled receptors family 3 profile domain-containing protein n=1 Tax=Mola mola TaxID=94237 RepID=A0A3Q3WMY9_MOLML
MHLSVFSLLPFLFGTPLSPSASTNPPHGRCGRGLHPVYRYLCDRRVAWGIVLETLTSAGFLLSMGLLLGLLLWSLCLCFSSRQQRSSIGGTVACTSMFLLATAGIFATTFSFIIHLTPQTCPTRLFLFSVLFALAFSCLLARCLALLGFAAARGWGEPALALGLFTVQVIISVQWLILVLVRDEKACEYSQEEFVMLQIFVLCLLAISLGRVQATLLCLTLLLSTCIWVVWITMLTWGNREVGRRPRWDDPTLSITLVANGWVLLMGHGLLQVAFLCWTSPSADIPGLNSPKEGRENGSFETDGENKRGEKMSDTYLWYYRQRQTRTSTAIVLNSSSSADELTFLTQYGKILSIIFQSKRTSSQFVFSNSLTYRTQKQPKPEIVNM